MQLRINMESMQADGSVRPSAGTLSLFNPPSGPWIRVDTFGYAGYGISPHYDSLLAKLVVHSRTRHFADVIQRAYRALCQTRIQGVQTNIDFLKNLLRRPELVENQVYSCFIDDQIAQLLNPDDPAHPQFFFADSASAEPGQPDTVQQIEGLVAVTSPLGGLVVEMSIAVDNAVHKGQQIALLEAMKMQHPVLASGDGVIHTVAISQDMTVRAGQPLVYLEPLALDTGPARELTDVDLDSIRPDLAEVPARHALGLDASRQPVVARRHAKGKRTARENIADLCDADTFIEYGALTLAAQRDRYSEQELAASTPADGLVAGMATINGSHFPPSGHAAWCWPTTIPCSPALRAS